MGGGRQNFCTSDLQFRATAEVFQEAIWESDVAKHHKHTANQAQNIFLKIAFWLHLGLNTVQYLKNIPEITPFVFKVTKTFILYI